MSDDDKLSAYNTDATSFKAKRLVQILYATELAFIFGGIAMLSVGGTFPALLLFITGLLLLPVKPLADKGYLIQGAALLLITLTLVLSFLVIIYEGTKDSALMAYPGILLFAVMLGNRKLFIFLLSFMIAVISFVMVSNYTGLHVNRVVPNSISDGIVVIIILLVIGYSVWLWSMDLNALFKKLEIENQRVLESQRQVEYLAHHDALTGLPNRILAGDRFLQASANASRNELGIALLYIDLDNFKEVNDTLGHESGDQYLKKIAADLKSCVRQFDSVCRQGGDEFLIILTDISSYRDVITIAEKLLTKLSAKMFFQSVEFQSSGSIGIALWPEDGNDYETLLKKADLAMYHAKDAGRNNFQFYDETLNRNLLEYLTLVSEIRIAIQEAQFELYFQPKISLVDQSTIGAEALIRWRHPEKGLIFPDEFIAAAEKSGLIIEIGRWVIDEACTRCKQWQDFGYNQLTVAVNVSPIQFTNSDLFETVSQSLAAHHLAPELLELEITESLLLDDSKNLKNIFKQLTRLGVKLSIDDFGTGYSNLKYLKNFEISLIKIDKSFIFSLFGSSQDEAIVNAIIQMAQGLNLKVVAEGVETESVRDYLANIGCDFGQGYLWSKPLSCQSFAKYLKENYFVKKRRLRLTGEDTPYYHI